MHLSEHHTFDHGLRALLDVHLWIELHHAKLDWNLIVAQAVRRGYSHWVWLSLRIVHDLFATPVPGAVFGRLGTPAQQEAMLQLAYEQIFAEGRTAGNAPLFLILALAQPSIGSAVRLIMRRLTPSRTAAPPDRLRSLSRPRFAGYHLAARRLLRDLATRVPQYYRAWRAGRLRWSSLRQAASLERRADQLRELMQAQSGAGRTRGFAP
jgi:hypothetical protein